MRRVEAAGTAAPSALAAPLDWLSGCRYNQRQVMHMTIQQILREKGLSRYQLSKRSGIPWATLADICSGKTSLTRCSAGTLGKLSAALDIPMEELLTMTVEQGSIYGLVGPNGRMGSQKTAPTWKKICRPACKKPWTNTSRERKTMCPTWTAYGESCTELSTPTSGATPSRWSRRTT